MTYFADYIRDASEGRIRLSLPGTGYNLETVLEGIGKIPFGSSIEVTEEVTIEMRPTIPALIDADFEWFAPKFYLGKWEAFTQERQSNGSNAAIYGKVEGYHGYLNSYNQRMRSRSIVTLIDPIFGGTVTTGTVDLDQCNFRLIPSLPSTTPLSPPGFQPLLNKRLLTGKLRSQGVPYDAAIKDSPYGFLGLFLPPGVELVRARYTASADNYYHAKAEASNSEQCQLAPNCERDFAAYISQLTGGLGFDNPNVIPPNTIVYSSEGACLGGGNGVCQRGRWTCQDGTEYYYWIGEAF